MVYVNEVGMPWQETLLLVNTGVTVTVATLGIELLAFTALNAAMVPVPEVAKPIALFVLVHVYEVPVPEKMLAAVDVLLHTT